MTTSGDLSMNVSQGSRTLAMWTAAVVFLLVYAAELGHFSLSIDEELATFSTETFKLSWLSQGRWGMMLIGALMPNFEAIPVLSTLMLGAGLVFAAVRGAADLRLDGVRACLFAVVLVGFPVWPHIAEFNTFAGGFGIGIAVAAYGAGLAVRANDFGRRALAVVAMAFAISVYQTLALFIVVYAGLALHAAHDARLRAGEHTSLLALLRAAATAALLVLLAGVVYFIVQRVAMIAVGVPYAYVDVYWRMDLLRASPRETLATGGTALAAYADGTDALYLGNGVRVLFLSWLGLLPWCLLRRENPACAKRLSLFWATLLAVLAVLAVPFVLSAGTLPIRAHIAWPLLAAWLASRIAVPDTARWRTAVWAGLVYFALTACSIGASLFYSERLARAADAALTEQLALRMMEVADPAATGPVPFTLSGTYIFPEGGQIQRAGVFGTSFFQHDAGNVYRVAEYMRTLGHTRFRPVVLGNRPQLIEAVRAMPAWPAAGSVKQVDGVIVVKLGEPTGPQLGPG